MTNPMDKCPKCHKNTWKINVYLHFTAPASFYGNMGKTARRHRDVKCEAALWETVSWWCSNSKCMHHMEPAARVRIEYVEQSCSQ